MNTLKKYIYCAFSNLWKFSLCETLSMWPFFEWERPFIWVLEFHKALFSTSASRHLKAIFICAKTKLKTDAGWKDSSWDNNIIIKNLLNQWNIINWRISWKTDIIFMKLILMRANIRCWRYFMKLKLKAANQVALKFTKGCGNTHFGYA